MADGKPLVPQCKRRVKLIAMKDDAGQKHIVALACACDNFSLDEMRQKAPVYQLSAINQPAGTIQVAQQHDGKSLCQAELVRQASRKCEGVKIP